MPALITQATGAMRAAAAAMLRVSTGRSVAVICADDAAAALLSADLRALLGEEVTVLTARDPVLRDTEVVSRQSEQQRLRALDAIAAEDRFGRAASAAQELAELDAMRHLAPIITNAFAAGLIPERITHNDTKINNVMLDSATGEAICVIDLDTVMPGLALYDFGDLVRVAANPAREDAGKLRGLEARRDMYDACAEGFLAGFDGYLTEQEIKLMPVAGAVITFELAVRFLSDYLDGDRYFKTARPGHNLDRARTQIALARSLEKLAG